MLFQKSILFIVIFVEFRKENVLMCLLKVTGLTKTYKNKKTNIRAVKGIDLSINEGECLGLVGESGCGKSTTAEIIARLIKEDSGTIVFNGTEITDDKRLKCVGKDLQMVFQNPKDSFDPKYSLLESVMMGACSYNIYSKSQLRQKALELIRYVGLKESYSNRNIYNLSGGECQKASIARALICSPKLIIFDEATSALDVSVQAQIIELMLRLKKENKMSFLFITHDLALASSVCDNIAVMYSGRIVEYGPCRDVLSLPKHPYTKQLILSVLPVKTQGEFKTPEFKAVRKEKGGGCDYFPFCPKADDKCAALMPEFVKHNKTKVLCWLNENNEV